MSNSTSEVSTQSWFSRIGDSFKGIVFGLILIAVSVYLIFTNEGRAVHTAKMLEEGAGIVISVPADAVDAKNQGKLILFSGVTASTQPIVDTDFGISVPGLKLKRKVTTYQWQEKKSQRTEKKLGGSTETITDYGYEKVWAESLISSQSFKVQEGHQNPAMTKYSSIQIESPAIDVGKFHLSKNLIGNLNTFEKLNLNEAMYKSIPETIRTGIKWSGGSVLYSGSDFNSPMIGDQKIEFDVVNPSAVTVVAQQSGDSLEPFRTPSGGMIELLQNGTQTKEAFFKSEMNSNESLTWVFRALGLLMMWIGFSMIFAPLAVFADVLPFFGSIVGAGTKFIAFLIATTFSIMTIAMGWIAYRPVLGFSLIACSVAVVFFARKSINQKAAPSPLTAPVNT